MLEVDRCVPKFLLIGLICEDVEVGRVNRSILVSVLSIQDGFKSCVVNHLYTVSLAHERFVGDQAQPIHLAEAREVALFVPIDLSKLKFVFDCPADRIVNNQKS